MQSMIKKIAVTTAAAASLFAASYAIAGSFFTEYIYFETAAKVKVVGNKVTNCNGGVYLWGQVTEHKTLITRQYCGGDLN